MSKVGSRRARSNACSATPLAAAMAADCWVAWQRRWLGSFEAERRRRWRPPAAAAAAACKWHGRESLQALYGVRERLKHSVRRSKAFTGRRLATTYLTWSRPTPEP